MWDIKVVRLQKKITKPALAITKKTFRYSYLEFLFFRNYELVEKDLVKVTYC